MREEAERFRMNLEAIFRSLEDGIVTVDGGLRTVEVNEAAERLCGFRRQDVVGRPLSAALLPCHGDCLETLRRTVAESRPAFLDHVTCRAPRHLLRKLGARLGKQVSSVSDSVLEIFLRHDWPGNVRELEHVLVHAFVLVRGDTITPLDLPEELRRGPGARTGPGPGDPAAELERLREALRRAKYNKTWAVRLLGISRRTLYRRLERLHERAD